MSSIPQNHFDENNLIDCVRRFFSSCKKTELGSSVFDHTNMHFKKVFEYLP